jgi:hypothetical protein
MNVLTVEITHGLQTIQLSMLKFHGRHLTDDVLHVAFACIDITIVPVVVKANGVYH